MTNENSSTRVQAPAHIPEYSSSQSQSSETHDGVVLNPSGRIDLNGEDLCPHKLQAAELLRISLTQLLRAQYVEPQYINNLLNDLGDVSRCDIKKYSNNRCKMRNYLSCHDKVVS